jgi:hypothetical protein
LFGLAWLGTNSLTVRAAPPWLWGGRCTSWGFFGREHLQGPQALGGTWYNFPCSGTPHDGACEVALPLPETEGPEFVAGSHDVPCGHCCDGCCPPPLEVGGAWFWMRSPDEEQVVITGLYNRYCIRCHGVDGRGVWDIPGVPDFTNPRWQATRSDKQIARIIIEGRGAVMPPFRGTLTLEEACAMARYLRKFLPGTELSKPDFGRSQKSSPQAQLPAPPKSR